MSVQVAEHDQRRCLVIDQGTHATRAVVIDACGRIQGTWVQEVGLNRIDRRRVEQDAAQILASVRVVIRQALADPLIDRVALATQRSTVVAWDRAGPLAPALSWQDTRGYRYIEGLDRGRLTETTGLFPSAHYAASKMRWILEHVPAVDVSLRAGRLYIGPLAAYLLWNLIGQPEAHPQIDHANASRTMLFNLAARDWDPWALKEFNLTTAVLPHCRPVRHSYGLLRGTAAPMTCVSGDQTAALHAGGLPDEGTAYVNIGTGAFVMVPTGATPIHHEGLLCGLMDSSSTQAKYCLEGTVNGAGAALSWAAQRWGIPEPSTHLDTWFRQIDDPPVFLNTIGGLGSPYWRQGPRASLLDRDGVALRQPPSSAAAAVAVAESILFLINRNLVQMRSAGCVPRRIQASGGLASSDGMCQRLADLSGLPVERRNQTEATAVGAAWLAFDGPAGWGTRDGLGIFRPKANPSIHRRYEVFLRAIEA